MSKNLKDCLPKLMIVAKSKGLDARAGLLYDLSKDEKLYMAVKEIVHNLVNKRMKLSEKDRKKLYRHRKQILALHKNKNKKNNRKVLIQSGGFLPILIPLVIQALSSAFK